MKSERWQRLESVLHEALQRAPGERERFVRESCDGDAKLESEVLALLDEAAADSPFLMKPLMRTSGETSAEPSASPRSSGPGGWIGSYRIVRELGAGGMGVVYLAMQQGSDFERPVALKVIRRGLDTEDVLRRFRLERRILAALRHPSIAGLIDAGETPEGRPFFAMEFVEGAPIDAYCDRERLPVAARVRLMQAVCDAVQHAHSNLVLHRDLKPSNVLVRGDGSVALLDFGIGKLLDAGPDTDTGRGAATDPATVTQLRAYTPGYAAPEQIRGEPVTTAADVFGLGLLLYRLLAGKPAFDEGSAAEFARSADAAGPVRPSAHGGPEVAGDLDAIVLKALRREPERRYASAIALGDDLQRYLDGRPVRARADTFAYRTGKFVRRHGAALAALVIVFAALAFATFSARARSAAVARERDKALEVRGFLLEMFGSSGANGADSMSVRQLLDGQAAQVPLLYRESPEMRAEMLAVLAEGYDRLGITATADSLAAASLAIRREVLPDDHPDIAASLNLLGWIRFERGKRDEGETLLRDALARWSRTSAPNRPAHARTINDLGVVRENAGDYAEAQDLYRRALEMRRAEFGDVHRAVAVTASNLSVMLLRRGDLPGAIAAAESALVVMRLVAGPDHQRSTLIQGNLAAMRAQKGDVAAAESEYRDLLARQIRVSGRTHPVTAGSMLGLASVLRTRGQLASADSMAAAALSAFEAAYGPSHARVAAALLQLGGVRTLQGRHAEARQLIDRAVQVQRTVRGPVHRDVATALTMLGNAHAAAGDSGMAARSYREALGVLAKVNGVTATSLSPVQLRLARALAATEKPVEADSILSSVPDSAWSKADRAAADSLRARIRRR